jgi:hypothetical protein
MGSRAGLDTLEKRNSLVTAGNRTPTAQAVDRRCPTKLSRLLHATFMRK